MNHLPRTPNIDQTVAERVRHTVVSAMSFLNTSVENLSTSKPNFVHAMRMFGVGTGKLKSVVAELEQIAKTPLSASSLGYSGTVEATYSGDNEEVAKWTRYFQDRVCESNIFPAFEAACPRTQMRSLVVGCLWYRFSSFMPWFLCQAASAVSTNEKRHYVIQTAFEELGMRDVREIHPEMFWDAAQLAGVTTRDRNCLFAKSESSVVIEFLKQTLLGYQSDEKVLGILLGLEIPAQENIETVFRSLAYTNDLEGLLNRHKFFQLHREIESEHVRLTVANFLRFCTTDEKKEDFTRGFMDGLHFWQNFWGSAEKLIGEVPHG